jgi:hypothetical protein
MLLFVQMGILIAGVCFLWRERKVIRPIGTWWSFTVRDLLWLVLIADQLADFGGSSLISYEVQIVVQSIIICLLLYSMWSRYQVQRQRQIYDAACAARIEHLEALRRREGW